MGLWAPDGSSLTTLLLPDKSVVTRLGGSLSDALARFGTPDVVHDNGIWMPHNHAVARAAAKRGIPRVVSTRGMLEPWAMRHKRVKKEVAWRLYQRSDLRGASWLHATSEAEASNLARHDLGRPVALIPNGVDLPPRMTDVSSRTANESRTAIFLGRIYPVKGLPMLVEAWSQVRPKNWRLVVAGPDEAGHLSEVTSLAAARGLAMDISFPGSVEGDAKESLFRNADLFVLPTHSESFGMAVGEALSYGLPVLTTTAAPWPWLEQTGCGWRVPPDVASLASGLASATSVDRSTLAGMGERGRSLVAERFQWSIIARRFIAEYESAA